jgi:hypothetical protein
MAYSHRQVHAWISVDRQLFGIPAAAAVETVTATRWAHGVTFATTLACARAHYTYWVKKSNPAHITVMLQVKSAV